MNPTPQESFSWEGCQRPCGWGQPSGEVCETDISFKIVVLRSGGSISRRKRKKTSPVSRSSYHSSLASAAEALVAAVARVEMVRECLPSEGDLKVFGFIGS